MGRERLVVKEESEDALGGRAVSVRDWTKGSVIRNLFSLSWPFMVSEGFWSVGMTLDMVWLGKLGAASVAGAGVAFFVIVVALTMQFGLATGGRALVARFVGAGDINMANHVAGQAFVVAFVFALIVTPLGFFLTEPILRLFALEAGVVAEGAAYMRVMFAGWLFLGLRGTAEAVMQASGDTMTPSRIMISGMVLDMLLSPPLTFGWGIFPSLGVRGPAVAYVTAYLLMTLASLWVLFTGRTRLRVSLTNFRLDTDIIRRIVKISLPATIMRVQMSFGNLVFTRLIAPFGTLAVAAQSLVQRTEMLLRLPGNGFSVGGGILVGQNLGASQPKQAERSGWLAVGLVGSVGAIGSAVILLWARDIVSIFTTEPELVKITSLFLKIEVIGLLAFAFVSVFQSCLSTVGDTLPPMLVSLGDLWLIRLPLALLLPGVANLDVYGVRWAIVIGMVAGAIAYTTYFRMGRWKRKNV